MRPFGESLPMALLRAREAAMRQFRPMLAGHDLTEQQWRVLRALAADEPADAGHIADRTFLLAPSLSRILAHLSDRGLIERRTDAGDQRRSIVALTPAGWRHVAAVAPESEAIYARIEAAFGQARLRALLGELEALAAVDLGEVVAGGR
ncbi:MAG TPA: homoprotocatechuate degradation operon regulator HpaR [Ilumatobacter sp.]|nr:homoprotocatechuate degradation operon regulator HpaR [Ilumatobacter sp.]